jgi:outer membrane protein assembly factor BamB
MPAFDGLLKGLDKDGDGKISFAETEGSALRDFFKIQDKNKNGYIEREEWEGGLEWMKKGKNVVLAIRPGGSGDITETHVIWSNEKGAPYVASPLFVDGKLFIVKDGGLATLYEATSGKVLYDKQRLGTPGDYYASPTLAGGRIYCGAVSGTILELDPAATDAPKVLHKMELEEFLAASPAFVENKVYFRTKEHLWAFGNR